MYFLIYSSYAAIDFDDNLLLELLVQAREKNKRLRITGMLYFFANQFLQLIEGEEAVVKNLGLEIAADPRHKYFQILKEGDIDERFFADWTMGFKSIDPENLKDVDQFLELNNPSGLHIATITQLMTILSKSQEDY